MKIFCVYTLQGNGTEAVLAIFDAYMEQCADNIFDVGPDESGEGSDDGPGDGPDDVPESGSVSGSDDGSDGGVDDPDVGPTKPT